MSSIFHNKSFRIKIAPTIIRTERVQGNLGPATKSSGENKSKSKSRRDQEASLTSKGQTQPYLDSPADNGVNIFKNRKSKLVHKRPRAHLNSDTSESENDVEAAVKKCKRQDLNTLVDKKRKLCLDHAFSEYRVKIPEMIHAMDIVSINRKARNKTDNIDAVTLVLKYPSSCHERYALIFNNDFDPADEIITAVKIVLEFFFAKHEAKHLKDSDMGVVRKLTKYYNIFTKNPSDQEPLLEFKNTVEIYNTAIEKSHSDGTFTRNLDPAHNMPLYMVEFILQQIYTRAVSPYTESLKKYENGTDNVYGELLPPLISKILSETGLNSEDVFVDLGSGVGNVVLQAALEFGCESWGCEVMENAVNLAEAQKREFSARCRLWGFKTGNIHLERGDFLENQKIHTAMKNADVILVNNQAFTPDLNQNLKDLFLDLKDGCRIISLKSFVPHGQQISARNLWDPANLFDVSEGE